MAEGDILHGNSQPNAKSSSGRWLTRPEAVVHGNLTNGPISPYLRPLAGRGRSGRPESRLWKRYRTIGNTVLATGHNTQQKCT